MRYLDAGAEGDSPVCGSEGGGVENLSAGSPATGEFIAVIAGMPAAEIGIGGGLRRKGRRHDQGW